jgi:hypothetical protein
VEQLKEKNKLTTTILSEHHLLAFFVEQFFLQNQKSATNNSGVRLSDLKLCCFTECHAMALFIAAIPNTVVSIPIMTGVTLSGKTLMGPYPS